MKEKFIAPDKDQELLTKYIGKCTRCKKEIEVWVCGSVTPKYCRFCGERVCYSSLSESRPSSKNVEA